MRMVFGSNGSAASGPAFVATTEGGCGAGAPREPSLEVTVFAVSSGEYSTYATDRIFATREAAQTYIDRHPRANRKDFDIRQWTVLRESPEYIVPWQASWTEATDQTEVSKVPQHRGYWTDQGPYYDETVPFFEKGAWHVTAVNREQAAATLALKVAQVKAEARQ